MIFRLTLSYDLDVGKGLQLFGSAKYIRDTDGRRKLLTTDDYEGNLIFADIRVGYNLTDWLHLQVGFALNHWRENHVFGSDEQGYSGFITNKYKPYLQARVNFGGVKIYYRLEYIHRDLLRDRHIANPAERVLADRFWRVWRSKATAEVAW